MNNKLIRLAERREQLIAAADAQRTVLAQTVAPWRTPLALADQGLAALRYVRQHPEWIAGGVALFVALRPNRVGTWLRRGWLTWQVVNKLRRG
jgi:hypothetical protein